MRRSWVGSVVAGLLVLAPIAAVAQSGPDDDPGEVEEVAAEREPGEDLGTLELVDETETNDVDEEHDPAGDANDHGERVSTVARCAPTGKLDVEGFGNHGAFVRATAHGDTIEVEGESYDLSTADGVEALCDWAETYEPSGEPATGARGQGRPDHVGPPPHAGGPDHAGTASHGGGEGNGNGKGKSNGKGKANDQGKGKR